MTAVGTHTELCFLLAEAAPRTSAVVDGLLTEEAMGALAVCRQLVAVKARVSTLALVVIAPTFATVL
jgi:hypothetical protein